MGEHAGGRAHQLQQRPREQKPAHAQRDGDEDAEQDRLHRGPGRGAGLERLLGGEVVRRERVFVELFFRALDGLELRWSDAHRRSQTRR